MSAEKKWMLKLDDKWVFPEGSGGLQILTEIWGDKYKTYFFKFEDRIVK